MKKKEKIDNIQLAVNYTEELKSLILSLSEDVKGSESLTNTHGQARGVA